MYDCMNLDKILVIPFFSFFLFLEESYLICLIITGKVFRKEKNFKMLKKKRV